MLALKKFIPRYAAPQSVKGGLGIAGEMVSR
jgi:hypothetical protein